MGLLRGAALTGLILLAAGCGGSSDPRPAQPPAPDATAAPALRSRPDLRPPRIAVDAAPRDPGARLILVSPRLENVPRDGRSQQQGAMLLDERGRTRLFMPVADGEPVTDVRVQRYRGEPVLTWWQGAASKLGIGRGEGAILDRAYRTIATVRAGNGETADLHEFLLTDRGTALLTIYTRARRDLRALGGLADGQITQGVVQEVDVETGAVRFEWESLDEIAPEEAVFKAPTKDPKQSWDYFHINSVAEDEAGDLVVSARHTSGVYKVSRRTGKVVWRLGGKRSDFEMGPGTEFGLQHDARPIGRDLVMVFDNVGGDDPNALETTKLADATPSSAKLIRLDTRRMRATLVARFDQPDGMQAQTQGNAQALADGGVMVGWGSTGAFSRFAGDGSVRFDAHLPAQYDSYRAYLAAWEGRPARPPALAATRDQSQVTLHASWNGSTEVQRWQAMAGSSAEALEPLGAPAEWTDLETTLVRMTDLPYVAVAALDARGRELAVSPAVHVPMERKR